MIEPARRHGPSAGTRERLVAGALTCLREKGLRATSSRDIAAAAGVNLAGITYHFGSKDGLIAEALLRTIRGWIEPALRALATEHDPVRQMLEAVRALQSSFEEAGDLLPVYLEALVEAPRHGQLHEGVQRLFEEVRTQLRVRIHQLRRTGFFPEWIEAEAMATLLVATADGLGLHAVLEPGSFDHRMVAGQAINLLLAAAGRSGSPEGS